MVYGPAAKGFEFSVNGIGERFQFRIEIAADQIGALVELGEEDKLYIVLELDIEAWIVTAEALQLDNELLNE